ncbi:hypothetical protein E2C01_085678 [Portunus trituberculatus]|uniref:Uncharacterized protein n=1 Tax=Portunus trituberculatus TaxID=210409 RepID=A0A5B7IYR9_PORTR|nr:hypothetical protein [Portunus trituberculatus]
MTFISLNSSDSWQASVLSWSICANHSGSVFVFMTTIYEERNHPCRRSACCSLSPSDPLVHGSGSREQRA